MNCNSNTVPLIDETAQLSCNNGCSPKDINIICKKIIIPTGQETLGIQGENNSAIRYFVVPKINENGDDLSDKKFSFIIVDSDNNRSEIEVETPEISDNYIKLKLMVNNELTKNSGNLQIQIQAILDDYVWKTFPATFKIIDSL